MTDPGEFGDQQIRRRLLEERAALQARSESDEDARRPVAVDQPSVGRISRMDALQMQAMALETERRRQVQLQRIAAALARLDEGEFGYCVTCGDRIPPKRLEFDLTTPHCVRCAEGKA